ncbi:hypothetical protein ACVGOW_05690 [Pseudonocardia saturnea]
MEGGLRAVGEPAGQHDREQRAADPQHDGDLRGGVGELGAVTAA